jgi:tight adherence protein C
MTIQAIYLSVVFLAVFGCGLLLTYYTTPNTLRQRLERFAQSAPAPANAAPSAPGWIARVVKLTGPLGKLSLPEQGWEKSPMRIRFMNAGFRGPSTPTAYFALKTILALAFPALWFFAVSTFGLRLPFQVLMASLVLAAAIGYYIPNVMLATLISRRKREIFENFPDAIDLMTVCVEAGLGLDAAMVRVAQEMEMTSPTLAAELHLVTLELRAGSPKEAALRNLALRTGVEEVDSLVAMLVQADRFGTSIADSLRVHAESLRTKRRQRAEEAAAKIPVKLLFPLIFCIFPSMLLVLLGPAMIQIYRILLPTMTGQQ